MKLLETLLRQPLMRFAIVGAGGYAVDTCALWFGTSQLAMSPYGGRVLSIFIAMIFTWLGNRYLTFPERAARGSLKAIIQEWMKFVGANLLGALVNYSTFAALIHAGPGVLSNQYVAQACGTLLGMVFNFLLSKHFVFSAKNT